MEIFVDGGLFELFLAIVFAYSLNYIFLKKYLLLLYSVCALAAPIALIFINRSELYFVIIGLCLFNSIVLVVLLWKARLQFPGKPLFDLEELKNKIMKHKKADKAIQEKG